MWSNMIAVALTFALSLPVLGEIESKSETRGTKQETAIKRLQKLGGHVRLLHDRNHPDHWIQIILATEPNKATRDFSVPADSPVDESPFDDSAMTAVRFLALDAPVNLHLRKTRVTAQGIQKLRGTKIQRLALQGESTNDDSLLELKHLPDLKILSIAGTKVSDDGLAMLKECPKLEELGLSGEGITDTGLQHVSQLQNLKRLSLGDGIGDTAAKYINRLNNLEELDTSRAVTSEFFRRLTGLPSLKKLSVAGENIDDRCVQHLAEKATNLQQLYIRRARISDHALKDVTQMSNLKVLCVDGCPISDAGIQHLQEMTNLNWLDLSDTKITDKSLEVIGKLKKLRMVFLMNTNISNDGLIHLRDLDNLRHLSLGGTKVKSIPDWLRNQSKLYISE